MFARQAFTTFSRGAFSSFVPNTRQSLRKYASEASSGSSSEKGKQFLQPRNFIFVAVGGVAAAAGLYWIRGQPSFLIDNAPKTVQQLAPAENTLKGDDQWVDLKLIEVETYNHNTKMFKFELPSENHVSGLKVASCLLTKYQAEEGSSKPIIRPYTPISDEDERGTMTLMVKRYDKGPMSTHMHDMVPNQRLLFKGPLPKYPWEANKHDHIGLIAGGTGITPMYQLIRAIFNNKEDKTKVTLVLGNISEEDILLKQELAHLENEFPQRFRAFYILNEAPKDWVGATGIINKDMLKTVLPEPSQEGIKLFVCGPDGMMKAVSGNKKNPKDQGELSGILKELGYAKEQVYKF